ncbi:MAG: glutaminyl-peptide cyclotransferase [Planctomycetota bacterium]|jgi:glutamine cyclotransferase
MKLLAKTTGSLFLIVFLVLLDCSCSDSKDPPETDYYTFEVVNTYPHDAEAFTQGLVFEKGFLYESTGQYGRSSIRKIELKTGNALKIHKLSDKFYGEGMTIYGKTIIQLTWRENIGFIFDLNSFDLLKTFTYPTEGWGITHDGRSLIMSDGSSRLHFLDPETFKEKSFLVVCDDIGPVPGINELEYVKGQIYANIYPTNQIARIDLHTGRVTGWIDLTGLLSQQDLKRGADVLNGIAYDKKNDRLFVTGKLWPSIFEIKIIKK